MRNNVTVDTPRILPPHNLFGDHGPRCPTCSGLGSVLRMPTPGFGPTRHATRCICNGDGLDHDLLLRGQISDLVRRLERQEQKISTQAQLLRKLKSVTKHNGKMSRQSWEELLAWATADGTAVANSAAEAIIMPNITIPGSYMSDGRVLSLLLRGRIGATATPTMTLRVRWGGLGGTIVAQSAAITLAAATAAQFKITLEIQTRLNGAAGQLFGMGDVTWGATIKTTNTPDMMGSAGAATPAAISTDLTVDAALSITAQWSAANASNTLTGHNYHMHSWN